MEPIFELYIQIQPPEKSFNHVVIVLVTWYEGILIERSLLNLLFGVWVVSSALWYKRGAGRGDIKRGRCAKNDLRTDKSGANGE